MTNQGEPITLDVGSTNFSLSSVPLFFVLNARSVFNKPDSLDEILQQIGPDFCLISETFESEKRKLNTVLKNKHYTSISYYRKNRAPGGGCAIIFNENRFSVTELSITTPNEIESCWTLAVPKCGNNSQTSVKRIAIGSYLTTS